MGKREKALTKSNERIYYTSSNLLTKIDNLMAKGANKKICSLILSLTLSSTMPFASLAKNIDGGYKNLAISINGINNGFTSDGKITTFKDIPATHWAYNSICKLQSIGAIEMTADANFMPNRAITREEFVIILAKALNMPATTLTTKFLDVHISRPSNPYINKFVEDGIIAGVSSNRFEPELKITREQAAAIMYRAISKYFSGSIKSTTLKFKDNTTISNWAKLSVQAMVAMNVFSGYPDGRFGPKGSITMAEAAKIILEVRDIIKGIDINMPIVGEVALSFEQQLNNNGMTLSAWELEDYGNLTEKYIVPDNVTRRIIETYPTSLVVAAPLTGSEEWSNWYAWTPGFEPYSNGTLRELAEKGIILIEEKEELDKNGRLLIWMRDKANIVHEVGPMLYGYEIRKIINISDKVMGIKKTSILDKKISYKKYVDELLSISEKKKDTKKIKIMKNV